MKVQGKVIFVTGGASGLGAAVVQDLISQGSKVVLLDLNETRGKEIAQENPDSILFHKTAVNDEEDVQAAIEKAGERWPDLKIGGVVNAAGVAMVGKTVGRDGIPFDLETFRQTVDINLTGTYNVSRLVAAKIVSQQSRFNDGEEDKGVIILVSSNSHIEGQMGQTAYASSKGAVASLALPMSRDLSQYGIRVVCISPSLFTTSMTASMTDKVKASIQRGFEFPKRAGHPSEFSSLVIEVFRNTFLNGTVIKLDGGSRMPARF